MSFKKDALESAEGFGLTGERELGEAVKRTAYLLGLKAYSRGELLKKLKTDFSEDICEEALNKAENLGYLNDREYAEKLAKKLVYVKHTGLSAVRWELKRRFISEEITEEVLTEFDNDIICGEITELLKRKYADRLYSRDGINRTVNALARRGYDYDDIKKCISLINSDAETEYNY